MYNSWFIDIALTEFLHFGRGVGVFQLMDSQDASLGQRALVLRCHQSIMRPLTIRVGRLISTQVFLNRMTGLQLLNPFPSGNIPSGNTGESTEDSLSAACWNKRDTFTHDAFVICNSACLAIEQESITHAHCIHEVPGRRWRTAKMRINRFIREPERTLMEMLGQLARAQVLALALLRHLRFKRSKKRIEWVTTGRLARTLTSNPAHWSCRRLLQNRMAMFLGLKSGLVADDALALRE